MKLRQRERERERHTHTNCQRNVHKHVSDPFHLGENQTDSLRLSKDLRAISLQNGMCLYIIYSIINETAMNTFS